MNETDILRIVADNPQISQRKIAKEAGISVGMVNFLIKKCIKKGWLKIEQLNARTVKYILTPKGIREKTYMTLQYIKRSYKAILDISDTIKAISEEQISKNKNIIIYGEKDELQDLIQMTLKNMSLKYIKIHNVLEIKNKDNSVIYVWDPEKEEEVRKRNYNYINILSYKKFIKHP